MAKMTPKPSCPDSKIKQPLPTCRASRKTSALSLSPSKTSQKQQVEAHKFSKFPNRSFLVCTPPQPKPKRTSASTPDSTSDGSRPGRAGCRGHRLRRGAGPRRSFPRRGDFVPAERGEGSGAAARLPGGGFFSWGMLLRLFACPVC